MSDLVATIIGHAVGGIADLVEAAVAGDLTSRQRLADILPVESRLSVEAMIDKAYAESRWPVELSDSEDDE